MWRWMRSNGLVMGLDSLLDPYVLGWAGFPSTLELHEMG
jgi:hypothetical protein